MSLSQPKMVSPVLQTIKIWRLSLLLSHYLTRLRYRNLTMTKPNGGTLVIVDLEIVGNSWPGINLETTLLRWKHISGAIFTLSLSILYTNTEFSICRGRQICQGSLIYPDYYICHKIKWSLIISDQIMGPAVRSWVPDQEVKDKNMGTFKLWIRKKSWTCCFEWTVLKF